MSKSVKISAFAGAMLATFSLHAETETNTMTNIVTVADACDIVAIGVDFGITAAPIPLTGILSIATNTATGNALTGNATHPDAASDGGAGNDDQLSLATPIGALNGLIGTVLSTVVNALPGVYVACTVNPTLITLTSSAPGSIPFELPISLGDAPIGTFAGKMAGVGNGASGANTVDYTLTFLGAPVSTAIEGFPVALFIGAYTATGLVPATQTGTVVPGSYTDVATAQVDF